MDITNIKLSHTQIAALQMLEAGAAKTRSEMRLSLEAMRQLTQHKFAESDGWYAYHITSDGRDYLEMVGKSSTAQRIAALEAENAALKAERDELRAAWEQGLSQIRQHANEANTRAGSHSRMMAELIADDNLRGADIERRLGAQEEWFRDGLLRAIQHMEQLAKLFGK